MIKLKVFQLEQVLNITQVAGDKVIHADDMKIFLNEPVAQVRTQEPGCAGYQNPFSVSHSAQLFFCRCCCNNNRSRSSFADRTGCDRQRSPYFSAATPTDQNPAYGK